MILGLAPTGVHPQMTQGFVKLLEHASRKNHENLRYRRRRR